MCYCPHFSDEETLVKKSHNSLHRGRGYLPGHLDQNQVFRLLAGLFLLCLSYGVGMTNFYSCPHRTKIEKLKQHKEGLIHRQGGTASARTRGKLWILSPRGDFKSRSVTCCRRHRPSPNLPRLRAFPSPPWILIWQLCTHK